MCGSDRKVVATPSATDTGSAPPWAGILSGSEEYNVNAFGKTRASVTWGGGSGAGGGNGATTCNGIVVTRPQTANRTMVIITACAVREATTGRRKFIGDTAANIRHASIEVVARTRSTSPSTSHTSPKEGERSSRSASNSAA